MFACALVFAVALVTALAVTPAVRWTARRLNVMDRPDGFRKIQKRPVPRLGGLAIYVAFFFALFVAIPQARDAIHARAMISIGGGDVWTLLLGATAVLLIGACDDVRGLRARWKLLGLTGVSVAMFAAGYRIEAVGNPFGAPVELGLLALPVTLFWFLGCTNAMNLIDGLDGLATGVCVFAGTTVFIASLMFGNPLAAFLSAALVGASLGFLVFNFNPASVFLGDSGSYLLGFLIASIGLRGAEKSSTAVALAIPLIAVGLPVMDTALAILRRWSKALPLSTCDREHIHHKLLDAGFTQRQAVLLMYVGCIVFASFALLLTATRNLKAGGLLLIFGIAVIAVVRAIGRSEINLTKRRLKGYLRRRGPVFKRADARGQVVKTVQCTENVESVWVALVNSDDRLDADIEKSPIPPRLKQLRSSARSGRL
jgi:UDP-GlcNAc:undecaprenyl-phosphate GlcNAc-1-phosphate transferase